MKFSQRIYKYLPKHKVVDWNEDRTCPYGFKRTTFSCMNDPVCPHYLGHKIHIGFTLCTFETDNSQYSDNIKTE